MEKKAGCLSYVVRMAADIDPATPRSAGSLETLIYTYTARHCIYDGGFVKIVFQCVCDFGTPQMYCQMRFKKCLTLRPSAPYVHSY